MYARCDSFLEFEFLTLQHHACNLDILIASFGDDIIAI